MSVEVRERQEPKQGETRTPLIKLTGVKKYFPIKQGIIFQKAVGNVHAVDGVDLEIYPGETVGLKVFLRSREDVGCFRGIGSSAPAKSQNSGFAGKYWIGTPA